MHDAETIVAVFSQHPEAEKAVRALATNGFDIKDLSLVGKGYHTDEKVVGFYNTGDRIKLWGARGAFWGGCWDLFSGGLFINTPVIGPVAVLGYLAAVIVAAVENAVLVGGFSAIGAALFRIGIPRDSVLRYETDVKTDRFLVMALGAPDDISRAKEMLRTIKPSRLNVHPSSQKPTPVEKRVAISD